MRHEPVKSRGTGSHYLLQEPDALRQPQFHEEKCLAAYVDAADAAREGMDSRVGARE